MISVNKKSYLFIVWLLLAPISYFAQRLLKQYPLFVEQYYYNGFYRHVVRQWSRFTGIVPFSIMEFVIIFLLAAVPVLLVIIIRQTIQAPKKNKLKTFVRPLLKICIIISIWYTLTVLLWNINYSRPSFSVLSGIEMKQTDTATLKATGLWLANTVNQAKLETKSSNSGTMTLQTNIHKTLQDAADGYIEIGKRFSFLNGQYGAPKPVLLSKLMSWTRMIGIYTVITAEANIDIDIPDSEIPFTILHELAHQRGIAPEDEANAVAWLSSQVHPRADFRYSGALQAYLYTASALYAADIDSWKEIQGLLSEEVLKDLEAQKEYWKKYDSLVDKVAAKANDSWLKSNGEKDGVKSYGKVVDLIIAEYLRNSTG